MVRASESQIALFEQNQRRAAGLSPAGGKLPRVRRRKEDLPENQLESQIKTFLEYRCWTLMRMHVGTYTPYRVLMALSEKTMTMEQAKRNIVRVGEKGVADWLAMRPALLHQRFEAPHDVFFWEAKSPGKKPRPEQLLWLRHRRETGTLAAWFDDYDGDWDTSFVPWYKRYFGER